MPRFNLARRRLIGTLALLGISGFIASSAPKARPLVALAREHRVLAARIARCFRHKASARTIGRAYLVQAPHEAEVELLLERILASMGATGGYRSRDVRLLFKQIHRAVRQDFEGGHTIRLKGWILSQTEARVCALAALV